MGFKNLKKHCFSLICVGLFTLGLHATEESVLEKSKALYDLLDREGWRLIETPSATEDSLYAKVQTLLDQGANPNYRPSASSSTMITLSADVPLGRTYKTLEILLEHGADPNIGDARGRTALGAAYEADKRYGSAKGFYTLGSHPGTDAVLRLLRKYGALHFRHESLSTKSPEVLAYLLSNRERVLSGRILEEAPQCIVDQLEKAGSDVTDGLGYSYSELVAKYEESLEDMLSYRLFLYENEDNLALLEVLLDFVDPNHLDSKGRHPLVEAVKDNKPMFVECLLRHGANPHVTDNGKPLDDYFKNKPEIAQLIHEYRDHAYIRLDNEDSGEVHAPEAEVVQPVIELSFSSLKADLDQGIDANVHLQNGETWLTQAVLNEDIASIVLLLERGANVALHNSQGKAPRELTSNPAIISLLALY